MESPTPAIRLRVPSIYHSTAPTQSSTTPSPALPTPETLAGKWHVTHSTLPLWKDKRNVCITYTPLPDGRIDDHATYQALSSPKIKSVDGIDTPSASAGEGVYDWRGKGWLKIASSHWEILGFGEEEGHGEEKGNQWCVTWFEKTLFTPRGMDVYSRRKEGCREETVQAIREALAGLGQEECRVLAAKLSEVRRYDEQ
jgi:hypothetical protein